jgi:RNA polymerase sigma-70 factor (ECF subfamily)
MTLEEFKIEVLPLKNKLYRFALRMLENSVEAEDIIQETLVRLWSRRSRLHSYRSIEAFAMTITRNLCLDLLRTRKREISDVNNELVIDNVTPYRITEVADIMKQVNQIIDGLPEQQKMIIHLRDIEGYDFDEIAEIMDLNLNVIRVNLSRARKKIREAIVNSNKYELLKN